MYYIFSFRSRSQSIALYEKLTKHGITAKLIGTPRAASIGCGLSVKIAARDIDTARDIFQEREFDTFLGLFYYNGSRIIRIER